MSKRILVVGAGFAGACYARELAEAGWQVDVIDKRPHIGGNAYDEIDANGVRIHKYGPHLFHTNNEYVVNWLRNFGQFVTYEHRVSAMLADRHFVPLPINRQTINTVFGVDLKTPDDVATFLARQSQKILNPTNAAEYLNSSIGVTLTNLFFRPYTLKMWCLELEEMAPAVVKRIPIRYDDEDRYFPDDRYQIMPRFGYTQIFESILKHPNISVTLSQEFQSEMRAGYYCCFNSMPIDVYFDEVFGPLPYRSIRFEHRQVPSSYRIDQPAVINYTDSRAITRETNWSSIPFHHVFQGDTKTVTDETPCDYRENRLERYYPVKTCDGRYDQVYQKYKALADQDRAMHFIGRCGTYQYLDMHQVINQSLRGAQSWLKQNY